MGKWAWSPSLSTPSRRSRSRQAGLSIRKASRTWRRIAEVGGGAIGQGMAGEPVAGANGGGQERPTGRAVIGAEEIGGGHGGGCWAVDAQKGMSSWRVTAWISASLTKIVSSAPTNSITSCDRSIHRNLDQDHCLGAWIDGIRA